jgi:hypothetical protein
VTVGGYIRSTCSLGWGWGIPEESEELLAQGVSNHVLESNVRVGIEHCSLNFPPDRRQGTPAPQGWGLSELHANNINIFFTINFFNICVLI